MWIFFSIITLPDWIKAVFHTQNILFPPSMFCKNVEKYFFITASIYLTVNMTSMTPRHKKNVCGWKFLALDSCMWMCCVVYAFNCQMWAATERNFLAIHACATTVCVDNCGRHRENEVKPMDAFYSALRSCDIFLKLQPMLIWYF